VPEGATGLRLVDTGTVILTGIKINFPAAPIPNPQLTAYGNLCDFVTATPYSKATLILEGMIANMTDVAAVYGLAGVHARASLNLMQYASQFQVLGIIANASAPVANLPPRPYMLKMYGDYPGANQQAGALSPTTANSSSGSGLMYLNWTETQAQYVTSTATNQASYPINFDVNYGLRNYITNIIRDMQSRPLNVIASMLF
jgi:hypothetical protein